MRTLLFTLLSLLSISQLFAQTSISTRPATNATTRPTGNAAPPPIPTPYSNDSIGVTFVDGANRSYCRVNDTVGVSNLELKVNFSKIKLVDVDTVNPKYYINVALEHVTTDDNDVKLITQVIELDRSAFSSAITQVHPILVEVANTDDELNEVFKVSIHCDSLNLDAPGSVQTITLCGKDRVNYKELFEQADTVNIGELCLADMNGIYPYKRILIGKRDALIDEWDKGRTTFKEGSTTDIVSKDKVLLRNRRFAKRHRKQDVKLHVKDVQILVSEGRMKTIKVIVTGDNNVQKNGYYINKGPVSLTNFHNRRYYKLHYVGSDPVLQNSYLALGHVLRYTSWKERDYYPSFNTYRLSRNQGCTVITSVGSPMTFFDARVYTDPKGLSGEDNGLIQTDINARFISNSNGLGRSYLTLFQYTRLGLSWSKFDSQFDTLKLDTFGTRRNNEILSLTRRSNASLRGEIDLIRGSRVHDVSFTLGAIIYQTKVSAYSPELSATDFKRVFTPAFYAYLGGTLFATNKVKADFKLPLNVVYNHDQPFEPEDGSNFELLLSPEIEIALNLKKNGNLLNEEQSPFVFGRFRYFDMPDYSGNNYWQMQVGVEVPITSLFD